MAGKAKIQRTADRRGEVDFEQAAEGVGLHETALAAEAAEVQRAWFVKPGERQDPVVTRKRIDSECARPG